MLCDCNVHVHVYCILIQIFTNRIFVTYMTLTIYSDIDESLLGDFLREETQIWKCILLGPPGRAQVFPYLSPGPLDFLVVCKNE